MSSSNCVRIKAYSPFKTKGCRTGLKKEASKAFDIAGALLGNTSGHWFGLRTSSLDGGPKAKMFPEFTQMSLLAGYYWFFNLTDLPLFQSHFSFFFCFTLLLDAVLGDETPFVVTPCTKVKVALQNLVFSSFLSSRCMHYLWKKSSNWLCPFDDSLNYRYC